MKSFKTLKNILLSITVIFLLLTGCSKEKILEPKDRYNYDKYLEYTYDYMYYNFSFKYPDSWCLQEIPIKVGKEGKLPSKYGVNLYVNDNLQSKDFKAENNITIFQSSSPIYDYQRDHFTEGDFIINNNKLGKVYTNLDNNNVTIYVVYNNCMPEFMNSLVKVSKDFYSKYEEDIWSIIGSVKVS
ncbi:hypothetical protein [Wansuia hejianensis]|uniref:Lipoprotein n=1 Tax=Wansuia hejianensis TaxID=2763667 RepID=A0A926INC8_9FIRM|nr:hypothetical protein [Wansuia hejianensis]MBC8591541.1 hypothetical protein [Wansuia hejianensis]